MDTKERLKHASEVLEWLAEGKELQCRRTMVGEDWAPAPREEDWSEAAQSIMAGRWEYRVKIEPVEFECVTRTIPGWEGSVVLLDEAFVDGTKVKVTLLES